MRRLAPLLLAALALAPPLADADRAARAEYLAVGGDVRGACEAPLGLGHRGWGAACLDVAPGERNVSILIRDDAGPTTPGFWQFVSESGAPVEAGGSFCDEAFVRAPPLAARLVVHVEGARVVETCFGRSDALPATRGYVSALFVD